MGCLKMKRQEEILLTEPYSKMDTIVEEYI
jgi:hypothetical protein